MTVGVGVERWAGGKRVKDGRGLVHCVEGALLRCRRRGEARHAWVA